MRRTLVVLLLLAGSGCVGSESTPCGSQVCPPGFRCDPKHDQCVQPEQLADCLGQPDGTLCTVDDVGGFHCDQEVCIPGTCSDGVKDTTEECDQGAANSDTAPDACRTTCTRPRCGDGVQDPGNHEACDDGEGNSDDAPDACRETCQLPRCGDGVVDPARGEACDDGNLTPGDLCSATCQVEACGNGVVDSGEQCDDGNLEDGDDCRSDCTLPRCGDGVIDAYEQCDDGAANSNTTPDACREACQLPRCGDDVIDAGLGEECDDGDLAPGDGCSATCQIEFCGNGVVDQGELCDCGTASPSPVQGCDGIPNGDTSDAPCRADCQPRHCGDGVLDAASGEECDHTALGPESCEDLGYHPGSLACLANCRYDPTGCGGYCGDGARNGGEVCDGADLGGNTCLTEGYYGGTATCQSNCQLNLGQCDGSCGDGIKNGTEVCDHQDFGGLSCADYGYYTGSLSCSQDCQTIDSTAGCEQFCGDGVVNGTEECDGDNVGGLYCLDFYGFDAGHVTCSPDCRYTFQNCYSAGWANRPSGTSSDLKGIHGFAWNDIWIVGNGGTVLHGRGGNRWDPISSGTTENLLGVHGTSSNDLWAVGSSGTILHWDGVDWSPHSSGTSQDLNAVFALSPTNVYAVGGMRLGSDPNFTYTNVLLKYDGTSWTEVSSGTVGMYMAVWASGPDNVYVGGGGSITNPGTSGTGNFSVLRRWDGTVWSDVTVPTIYMINALWGSGPNDIHASCHYATVLQYDGAWHASTLSGANGYSHMMGVWGTSASDVVYVGRHGTIYRYDGSDRLSELSNTGSLLQAVWGSAHNDIYAVGTQGKILRFGGGGTGWQPLVPLPENLAAVAMTSESEAFAGGAGGVLYRWDGATWSSISSSTTRGFQEMSVVSPSSVYATVNTSDIGNLLHYNGSTWSVVSSVSGDIRSVLARSDSEIYLAGGGSHIWYFNGTTWQHWNASSVLYRGSGSPTYLNAIWASAPDDIYVGGWFGRVGHWDGSSWSLLDTPTNGEYIERIDGTGPNDVWVFGRNGMIMHFDGVEWTRMQSPILETLGDSWITPGGEVFAVGVGGTIIWYDGVSWTPMYSRTAESLNSIHGISRGNLMAVGSNGTILHFQGQLPEPAQGLIDWCNLQWPAATTTSPGVATEAIYGQVWVSGVTDAAGQGAGILAEVGFGPTGAKPWLGSSWTWTDATFNVDVGNNDEYMAAITPTAFGTFNYAFRFSRDGGASWLYCDQDGANRLLDYSPSQAGAMAVVGCGDGVMQAGEECDDGNTATGDGCNPSCSCEEDCTLGSCAAIDAAGQGRGDGVYLIDPAGSGVPFPVYCDMTSQGGAWTLVRRTHAGANGQFPLNDNLAGTSAYGNYVADPLAEATFSLAYTALTFTEMRFSTGDGQYWLSTERSEAQQGYVSGACGQTVTVNASHLNPAPHQVVWCKRTGSAEDPWISAADHSSASESESHSMLYGENGNVGWPLYRTTHDGLNVWVR